MAVEVDAPKWS